VAAAATSTNGRITAAAQEYEDTVGG
jgi:hypothetical protein